MQTAVARIWNIWATLSRAKLRNLKYDMMEPLVLLLIFMQRHLVNYFGNSSGKTKHSNMFEIKFASHLNCYHYFNLFLKVSILVAVKL